MSFQGERSTNLRCENTDCYVFVSVLGSIYLVLSYLFFLQNINVSIETSAKNIK